VLHERKRGGKKEVHLRSKGSASSRRKEKKEGTWEKKKLFPLGERLPLPFEEKRGEKGKALFSGSQEKRRVYLSRKKGGRERKSNEKGVGVTPPLTPGKD